MAILASLLEKMVSNSARRHDGARPAQVRASVKSDTAAHRSRAVRLIVHDCPMLRLNWMPSRFCFYPNVERLQSINITLLPPRPPCSKFFLSPPRGSRIDRRKARRNALRSHTEGKSASQCRRQPSRGCTAILKFRID